MQTIERHIQLVHVDKDNCRNYFKDLTTNEVFATVIDHNNKEVLHTCTRDGEPLRPVATKHIRWIKVY